MSIIYFVRHGESEANIAHCVNDDPSKPIRLTSKGRSQCEVCAVHFRDIPLTHAYSSEFPRTQETLQIILSAHPHLQTSIDARLNEWQTGMDGKSIDFLHHQMDRGVKLKENFDDVVNRVERFIDDMKSFVQGSHILVVSHKITITACLVAAGKIAPNEARRFPLDNCEIVPIPIQPKPHR